MYKLYINLSSNLKIIYTNKNYLEYTYMFGTNLIFRSFLCNFDALDSNVNDIRYFLLDARESLRGFPCRILLTY